ncbi:MAG: glycine betaine ABC transporter substrate-binding protein, partial [Litorivicinus sp.]
DIVPELWSNSVPAFDGLVDEGKVIVAGNTFANGGEEGWWIPAYVAEAHPEATTLEGILANPALVDGRFHNCPVGWGCRIVNDNLKVVHDMEGKGLEVFDHGSGANLAASIAAAYEDKAPWFGYYWGPTAVLGKYDMTKVTIGPVDEAIHIANSVPGADAGTIGVSDFPASPVYNAMTTAFIEREPAVADFISKMVLPNDVVSKMLAWKDSNNASADETAAWLMTNYKDLVLGMLNEDARKNISALL